MSNNHYLYSQDLPRQLDPDELIRLVDALCEGDLTKVDPIASAHIRMVINITRKLSRGKQIDDLISVSLEGLVEAIHKYPAARAHHSGEQKGITAYIAGYVRYKILRYKAEDTLIRIPQESQQRLCLRPLNNMLGTSELAINQTNLVAINEILKMITDDPVEKVIIKLRRRGHTDQEIADMIKMSVTYVQRTRTRLEKRFYELYNEKA